MLLPAPVPMTILLPSMAGQRLEPWHNNSPVHSDSRAHDVSSLISLENQDSPMRQHAAVYNHTFDTNLSTNHILSHISSLPHKSNHIHYCRTLDEIATNLRRMDLQLACLQECHASGNYPLHAWQVLRYNHTHHIAAIPFAWFLVNNYLSFQTA